MKTGIVKVLRVVAAHDVGKAINPMGCEQQVEGAVIMGLSNTLYEEFKMENGRILNDTLADYKLATMQELPEIVTILVESVQKEGPFGAKGIGEPAAAPTAPAIANAIYKCHRCPHQGAADYARQDSIGFTGEDVRIKMCESECIHKSIIRNLPGLSIFLIWAAVKKRGIAMDVQEKKIGRVFRASLKQGEDFFEEIYKLAEKEGIREASLFVIGALSAGRMITGFKNSEGDLYRRELGQKREFFAIGNLDWPSERPNAVPDTVPWEKPRPYRPFSSGTGSGCGRNRPGNTCRSSGQSVHCRCLCRYLRTALTRSSRQNG